MLTKEQKLEMYSMRLDGCTLQEIGDKFGMTKERVRQILPNAVSRQAKLREQSYYPNLTEWMLRNRLPSCKAAELFGISANRLCTLINSDANISKRSIDGILSATGMTYEVAFATERTEEA